MNKRQLEVRLDGAVNGALETAEDLLSAIRIRLSKDPTLTPEQSSKRMGELGSVANRISECLFKKRNQVLIREIIEIEPQLDAYLEQLGLDETGVARYRGLKNSLTKYAKNFGYQHEMFALADEWETISRITKDRRCNGILNFAIRNRRRPSDFSETDLVDWGRDRTDHGCNPVYVLETKRELGRVLRNSGMQRLVPQLCVEPALGATFRIPLTQMTETLRSELEQLVKWTQSVPLCDAGIEFRSIGASALQTQFEQLYGFAKNAPKGKAILTLPDLFTKDVVAGYVKWLFKERGWIRSSILARLSGIHSAMTSHPVYRRKNYSWYLRVLKQVPKEAVSKLKDRRSKKSVTYDLLVDVPGKMRSERSDLPETSPRQLALKMHDELLMEWVVSLPWPPRLLRECQIEGNVFLAELPKERTGSPLPRWVKNAIKKNSREEFWQFRFRGSETSTHREVWGTISQNIVPLLVGYLQEYRPVLVGASDSRTLFLNRTGRALTNLNLVQLIGNLTLRYCQTRVVPSLIPDIFARQWLRDHPRNFAGLARILNVELLTVIRRYGKRHGS